MDEFGLDLLISIICIIIFIIFCILIVYVIKKYCKQNPQITTFHSLIDERNLESLTEPEQNIQFYDKNIQKFKDDQLNNKLKLEVEEIPTLQNDENLNENLSIQQTENLIENSSQIQQEKLNEDNSLIQQENLNQNSSIQQSTNSNQNLNQIPIYQQGDFESKGEQFRKLGLSFESSNFPTVDLESYSTNNSNMEQTNQATTNQPSQFNLEQTSQVNSVTNPITPDSENVEQQLKDNNEMNQ